MKGHSAASAATVRLMGGLIKEPVDTLPEMCRRAFEGSSWYALLVAIHIKATSRAELLRVVGFGPGAMSNAGFDVCCDAWNVYEDALANGANL